MWISAETLLVGLGVDDGAEFCDVGLPVARELGAGIVAYSPPGRGMLTGSPAATTGLSFFGYRRILPRWCKRRVPAGVR